MKKNIIKQKRAKENQVYQTCKTICELQPQSFRLLQITTTMFIFCVQPPKVSNFTAFRPLNGLPDLV